LWCTFAGKSKVINITDNTILKDIKARLQSGDRQVTLEFANKEDKNRESSRINRENNGNKEDKSREGSRIDRENNSESKDN
jgi:hypothetical protein